MSAVLRPVTAMMSFLALAAVPARSADGAKDQMLQGNHVIVSFGGGQGPHARLTFNKNRAAREAVVIETFQTGAAGWVLAIMVDADPKPVFTHTFTADECQPVPSGHRCVIRIAGREAMPGILRERFARGHVSHISIKSGEGTDMAQDAVLDGFGGAIGRSKR